MANIQNELNKIKNAVYGREVRGSIHDGIDKINREVEDNTETSDDAKQQVESIQSQVNQLVVEGDSSVEAAAARVDEKNVTHDTLKERIDNGFVESERKILNAENKSFYNGIKLSKEKTPLLVFVDDDTNIAVWDKLKHVVEQENVPITLAAITGRIDNDSNTLTLEKLKKLQEIGFEIQSHSVTHRKMGELTREEQRVEFKESKSWLQRNGFSSDAFIYPFGSENEDTLELVDVFYTAGVHVDNGNSLINNTPVVMQKLQRVYYNHTAPDNYAEGNRIQLCKDRIDEAIDNDALIIIGMHCWADYFDSDGLIEVIQYAKGKGIRITTLSEALDFYGNIIDLPDFKVDATGKVHSGKIGNLTLRKPENINGNSSITRFDRGLSYSEHVTSTSLSNMPVQADSVMLTYKGSSGSLSYQEVLVLYNHRKYTRNWSSSLETWGDWKEIIPNTTRYSRTADFGTVPANGEVNIGRNHDVFKSDSAFYVTLNTLLPEGLIFSHTIEKYIGRANYRLTNITDTPIEVGEVEYVEIQQRF